MKTFSIYNRLRFFLKKPILLIIVGSGKAKVKEIISQIFKQYFKLGREIFILEAEEEKINKFKFFFKNAKLGILIINSFNQPSLIRELPSSAYLVLNNDDEKIREFDNFDNFKTIKFSFKKKSDLFISDIKYLDNQTNFKLNYKGSIIPFWLKGIIDEEKLNLILCLLSAVVISGINLVEISQFLKELDF